MSAGRDARLTEAAVAQVKQTLDLGLQAWRTTKSRDDFLAAHYNVEELARALDAAESDRDAALSRLSTCEAALKQAEGLLDGLRRERDERVKYAELTVEGARSALAERDAAVARAEHAEQALRDFADRRNWHHNFDGAGLVYTGPGSNEISAIEAVTSAPRAALSGKDTER